MEAPQAEGAERQRWPPVSVFSSAKNDQRLSVIIANNIEHDARWCIILDLFCCLHKLRNCSCTDDRWKSPGTEFERAGVGLTDGKTFLGEGYVRVNFACPRATLMEGLRRMEQAVIAGYRERDRASAQQ